MFGSKLISRNIFQMAQQCEKTKEQSHQRIFREINNTKEERIKEEEKKKS